jgi:DNA-binding beta-propeller fold protein YncE
LGNLFVVDPYNCNVVKFTSSGTWDDLFASGLVRPWSLAFDGRGNLFVANANDGTISRLTPAGTQITFASRLSYPLSIAFEPVTEKLRNVSARGFVQSGENVLIGGFIVGGNAVASNAV